MDLLDLFVKIGIDDSEYNKGLDNAEKTAYNVGRGIGTALNAVGKVAGAAISAAATGISAIAQQSVKAYANYEQLLGGVQKLYGTAGQTLEEYAASIGQTVDQAAAKYSQLEQAQTMMLQNAQNAYATAGMSANEYMEKATGFAASLIDSLEGDTVKAAELTDTAMRAISDNFNTFGGDIGMIQGAFQGFAKQNYQMLDNLKLGYGGSRTEMERLIADANEYAKSMGQAGDLTINSFADVITAIDLVQQKQNIAGTTAREAATTIAGSLGMVKGAWENLLTGIGDENSDLEGLINNLVTSAETALGNLQPVIETTLNGIVNAIGSIVPMIGDMLPPLIESLLPTLLDAATSVVEALAKALPEAMQIIVDVVPDVIDRLIATIIELLPKVADTGVGIIISLVGGISATLPELIPAAVEAVIQIAEAIIDNLDAMVDASVELVTALADGIIQSLPILLEKAPEIIIKLGAALVRNLEKLRDFPQKIFETIADGLVHIDWRETADKMMQNLIGALDEAIKQVQVWIDDAMSYLTGAESVYGGDIANVPTSEFINNMNAGKDEVVNAVGDFTEAVQGAYDAYYGVADKNNAKVVEYSAEAMGKMADAQAQSAKNAGRTTQEAIAEILGRRNQTTGAIVDSVAKTVDITKEQIEAKFQELETTMYQQGFSQDWLVQQERAYIEALDHSTDLYKDYNLKLLKTEKSLSEQAAKQRQSEIEKRQKEQQNLISQQVKNFESSLDGMIKAAKTKIDEYNKVIEVIKSQISTFASSLSKSYKDMFTFDVDEATGKTTAVKTKNFITNSIKELEQYYDNIQKLRERGVGESMLNQLTSMSATEGLAVTEYWQSLSDNQLKALDLKWNRYQDLTGKVSASLYSDELEEAETKLDTERNTMLGEIKEAVNTGFSDLLNATGGEMVTVNVNGIQYQSMTDLVNAVAKEMGAMTNRKAAGYAV